MSNVIDLDILFEKKHEQIKFKSKDGQEFILKIKLTPEIALKSIKAHREGKEELESAAESVACLIRDQLKKEVDEKWVLEYIEWDYLLYVSTRLSQEVNNSMNIISSSGKSNGAKKK